MGFKFAIINPKSRRSITLSEPLNILTLATYLQNKGIKVKIIDELAGDNVLQELKCFNPALVGFTSTTCTYPRAVALLRILKPIGYKTVIGGAHASMLPEKAIEDGFDMVVVGEGERTVFDLIEQGKGKGIFRTSRENILKSDEIPLPDRRLINMDFYRCARQRLPHDINFDFVPIGAYSATFLSSRGCPHQCIFCHNTWRDSPVRFMSVELLMEEMERLMTQYNIRYVWFNEDDFFLKRDRVTEFCRRLIEKRLHVYWATATRPDSVNEEVLSLAAKAGCRRLSFGFESGSQRILDLLNKKSKVEDNLRVAHLCHKYNIDVLGLIMVGNPTETHHDIALTRDFIRKARFDSIAISTITPFPGTELWKWCEREGLIHWNIDFSSFNFKQATIQIPGTFPPVKVKNMMSRLLIESYLFNPRIRNRFIKKFLRNPMAMLEIILETIGVLPNYQ